jgi:hypothetical protein
VHGADAATTNCTCSFCNLLIHIGVLKHGIGPILVLFSFQPGFKILLVSVVYAVVFFIHFVEELTAELKEQSIALEITGIRDSEPVQALAVVDQWTVKLKHA